MRGRKKRLITISFQTTLLGTEPWLHEGLCSRLLPLSCGHGRGHPSPQRERHKEHGVGTELPGVAFQRHRKWKPEESLGNRQKPKCVWEEEGEFFIEFAMISTFAFWKIVFKLVVVSAQTFGLLVIFYSFWNYDYVTKSTVLIAQLIVRSFKHVFLMSSFGPSLSA